MIYVLARLVQDNGLKKEKGRSMLQLLPNLCIAWFNSSKLLEHFEPSPLPFDLRPPTFDLRP